MGQDHYATDHDRLIAARLHGTAQRHARWREPTEAETAAAVEELREVAGGPSDLPAEVASLQLGFHEGTLNDPKPRPPLSAQPREAGPTAGRQRRVGCRHSGGGSSALRYVITPRPE